ncbi:NAD(P)-binding protein [Xylariomycetidae sp. FL2044]|nr:NAD(P)-binding protein [Xylariomycetidae sp. FL2044]
MASLLSNYFNPSTPFDPSTDIPPLTNKVILVTGGNAGLGEATLTAYAQHAPAILYLGSRSATRGAEAASRIRDSLPSESKKKIDIRVLELDLASLASVRAAARRVRDETGDRLDILQLNGGAGMVGPGLTEDGYEVQFGTSYLGHALLTQLLMPALLATATAATQGNGNDVRVIAMSSVGHRVFAPAEGILFDELRTPAAHRSTQALYGQSRLAATLFARELARRYSPSSSSSSSSPSSGTSSGSGSRSGITTASLHPGTVRTKIWGESPGVSGLVRRLLVDPMVRLTSVSAEVGARNQLWLSVAPRAGAGGGQGEGEGGSSGVVVSGEYYEPGPTRDRVGKHTRNDELAARLWAWTEKELAKHGGIGWPDWPMSS